MAQKKTTLNMAHQEPLLYAVSLQLINGITQASEIDLSLKQKKNEFHWYHLCALNPQTQALLVDFFQLDPIIIDAMLADETRSRALIRPDGALLILKAINFKEGGDASDMISLRIWVEDNRVITTRQVDIRAIEDIKSLIAEGQGPLNGSEFISMVVSRVYERMEVFIEDLDDEIKFVDAMVAKQEGASVGLQLTSIRQRTALFLRHISPQRMAISSFLKCQHDYISEKTREHLVESLDLVTRYIETLIDVRENTVILHDEIERENDSRLNRITYLFTLVATVFLPLSFLTGLFGVNLGGLPGLGSKYAFWIFSVLCVVIAALQISIFKKKKWF